MFRKSKTSLVKSEVSQQKQSTPSIESQKVKEDRKEKKPETNHEMGYFGSALPNHHNARSRQQGPVSDSEVSMTYRLGYKFGL